MTETDTQREMVSEADICTMLEAFAGSAEPLPNEAHRRHRMSPRTRSLVAAIVLAAVVATPALAFSTTVRELVGLSSSPPALQATVTGMVIHKKPRFGLAKVTVTFTVGEPGKPPGSGITFGSHFQILLFNRAGRRSSFWRASADGKHGRYSETTLVPTGGIGAIQIGGYLNYPTGGSTAKNAIDFWIPVTTKRKHCNAAVPCPL